MALFYPQLDCDSDILLQSLECSCHVQSSEDCQYIQADACMLWVLSIVTRIAFCRSYL